MTTKAFMSLRLDGFGRAGMLLFPLAADER
jgi:hypothetical protein